MNETVLALTLTVASSAFSALAEETSAVKDSVKSMVAGVVSAGKDALSGVNDGRKTGSSVDGAQIITNKMTLIAYVSPSVLSVEKTDDTQYKVTLALRNISDTTVRLTNLNELNSLQLLDKDGFVGTLASEMTPQQFDITIPANAAMKARYTFNNLDEAPAILRLYGEDLIVPTVKPSLQ